MKCTRCPRRAIASPISVAMMPLPPNVGKQVIPSLTAPHPSRPREILLHPLNVAKLLEILPHALIFHAGVNQFRRRRRTRARRRRAPEARRRETATPAGGARGRRAWSRGPGRPGGGGGPVDR